MSETESKPAGEQLLAKVEKYAEQQRQALRLNEVDLNEDFRVQAPSYVDAAIRYHKAARIAADQKVAYEKLKADVWIELTPEDGKKPTVASLEAAVARDERVLAARQKMNLAEAQAGIYQSCMRGWEHKRDMLIQAGSTARAEFQANVSIKSPKRDDDDDESPPPRGGGGKRGGRYETI